MAMIRIDGREYQVKEGQNLLQACLSLGLDVPYFCWHPAMGSIGACRQCAVIQYQNAEDERGRLVMSCMTPVADGAIFSLTGEKATTFRKAVIESLMLNHPHDCPVCTEGGECHLQDMTVMVGHRDRRFRGRKRTHRNQYLGPLVHHEMNRCITCYRCTRFYRDYAGGTDLAALACHNDIYFGRHEDGVLESEFAGNLVEVCPTGVFTDKPLAHDYTRKWDLQSAPSICAGCAVGCNTAPGERYGELKRVHNRYHGGINGYFLCDRGRFGGRYVNNSERLDYPGLRREDGRYDALDHHGALQFMRQHCQGGRLAGIGSPRASVEANYLLRLLVGADNFAPGFSPQEQPLVELALALQQHNRAALPDLKTMESADAVLILGEDVTNTAPRIALSLRQSVRNRALALGGELGLHPWQDAAVRNLAQDQRSPLYIASVAATRLDDVAAEQISLAPREIARLGAAVARRIQTGSGETDEPLVGVIAEALSRAEHPLVLTGTGCASAEVMRAAARVAEALCQAGRPALFATVVPEVNSLGQALLAGPEAPDLEQLAQRAAGGDIDTLVVLENDLYRRGSAAFIDRLLQSVPRVIALDGLDNATLSASALALPAASIFESEGTVVNMEGRAQRHFPVFLPQGERRASWVWLLALLQELDHPRTLALQHFDDVTRACAADIPALAGITGAAPDREYRNHSMRVPRQPHRYSGRTAMRANVSVHEPKQPEDEDSALAFSMEGLNRYQPGALLPYVWAPGWNSNQAIHRFQAEVGGQLRDGPSGISLLAASGPALASLELEHLAPRETRPGHWQLVPRQRIFGSEELSARSDGIRALVEPGFVELRPEDAARLGVRDGDGVVVGDALATLEVRFNDSLAAGCIGFSVGLSGTGNLIAGAEVTLQRAERWQRRELAAGTRAPLIGSDGGRHV